MKILICMTVAVLVLVAVPSPTYAQDSAPEGKIGVPIRRAPHALSPALTQHLLRATYFDTSGGATATCTRLCFVPIFTESIVCPVGAGSTCTYQIILESQNVVSSSDNGLYQFIVDGAAPSPGPTDGSGRESFVNQDPNSGGTDFFVRHNGSYAVTATVTNSTAKQTHAIAVNIGCADSAPPSGCIGEVGFANLQIEVFTP